MVSQLGLQMLASDDIFTHDATRLGVVNLHGLPLTFIYSNLILNNRLFYGLGTTKKFGVQQSAFTLTILKCI